MYHSSGNEGGSSKSLLAEFQLQSMNGLCIVHGLGMPSEEIAFTAQPKIKSQSQIFRYGEAYFVCYIGPNFRFL